ncbi:hypothetical protein Droror1_Dr00012572 [Drosera rotundifolia]
MTTTLLSFNSTSTLFSNTKTSQFPLISWNTGISQVPISLNLKNRKGKSSPKMCLSQGKSCLSSPQLLASSPPFRDDSTTNSHSSSPPHLRTNRRTPPRSPLSSALLTSHITAPLLSTLAASHLRRVQLAARLLWPNKAALRGFSSWDEGL